MQYSHKRCADDIKELASQLGLSKIILGGHDWYGLSLYLMRSARTHILTNAFIRGAILAYRIALWHPDLVAHLFTVCVPFFPPREKFTPLEESTRTTYPNFTYQLQFRSGEVEKSIRSKDDIRNFLSALYGGRTEDGEFAFDATRGVPLGKTVKPSRLLSEEVSCRNIYETKIKEEKDLALTA